MLGLVESAAPQGKLIKAAVAAQIQIGRQIADGLFQKIQDLLLVLLRWCVVRMSAKCEDHVLFSKIKSAQPKPRTKNA